MALNCYEKSSEEVLAPQPPHINRRYLRLPQIIGQPEVTIAQAEANRLVGKSPKTPRSKIVPLIPICRASWWAGVKSGKYPRPIKLGSRTAAWRESDIMVLLNQNKETCKEGDHA